MSLKSSVSFAIIRKISSVNSFYFLWKGVPYIGISTKFSEISPGSSYTQTSLLFGPFMRDPALSFPFPQTSPVPKYPNPRRFCPFILLYVHYVKACYRRPNAERLDLDDRFGRKHFSSFSPADSFRSGSGI